MSWSCPFFTAEKHPARGSYLVLAGGGPMAALPCAFALVTSLLLSAAPSCMAEEAAAVVAASLVPPEASACGLVLPAATLAGTAAIVEATCTADGGALAERGGGGAGARRMGGFRWLLVLHRTAQTPIYSTQHACMHTMQKLWWYSWLFEKLESSTTSFAIQPATAGQFMCCVMGCNALGMCLHKMRIQVDAA